MEGKNDLVNEFHKFAINFYTSFLELCKTIDKEIYVLVVNTESCLIKLDNDWVACLDLDDNSKYLIELRSSNGVYHQLENINLFYLEIIVHFSSGLTEKVSGFIREFQLKFISIFMKIIINKDSNPVLINNIYFEQQHILSNDINIEVRDIFLSEIERSIIICYSLGNTTHITSELNINKILALGKLLWEKQIEARS